MNQTRILIFTGGNLGLWALQEIQSGDFLLGADRGAMFLLNHGFCPDLALGDFDSVTPQQVNEIRQISKAFESCDAVEKDQSDTELAFDWAIRHIPKEIVLLGALGTRFDHSLANVHLLRTALEHDIPCRIIDEYNEVILINRHATLTKNRYTNVSLLPLTLEVTGITLHGFQYPLHQAALRMGQSLAVSNILVGETGEIEMSSGLLLVIQSID